MMNISKFIHFFVGLYNFEVVDEAGKPKTVSFRLPSLAQSSIYHEVNVYFDFTLLFHLFRT